ncbi:MAG: diguanylate cyclase [FCB group bacterium]|nr:diguanylate cyclase [FCB group bacterium]
MKLNLKTTDPSDVKELSREIKRHEEAQSALLETIQGLLFLLKNFSLDQKEIDSDSFRKDIDALSDSLSADDDRKNIDRLFKKHTKKFLAYIERQNDYIRDKEKELKDIIELLTTAISELDTENQIFTRTMYLQSEKLEAITRLDDIKTIKNSLKVEIGHIKETVRKKQEQDRRRVESLSQRISRLNVELEQARTKSLTDGLTGINNRQSFDLYIRELVEKNSVIRHPFAMFILDIDDFKAINDTYGHQTGDRILLAMVMKCKEFIRTEDFIARYGGDEFIIILQGASLRNAVKRAKQISKSIAGSQYRVDDLKKGLTLSFTVSIGVSAFRKGDTITSLINRADEALYASKKKGKNGVVSEKDLRRM